MLRVVVPQQELFNAETNRFEDVGGFALELEHSLASVSKWEEIWEKPFLGKEEKTPEETLSYIQCMILTPDVPPNVLHGLTKENLEAINDHLKAKKTATWFNERADQGRGSSEVVTAELIYYWMTAFNVPFECQYWHLNRLLTLLKVCNEKNAPKKKMNRRQAMQEQKRLNAQRRAEYGTRG